MWRGWAWEKNKCPDQGTSETGKGICDCGRTIGTDWVSLSNQEKGSLYAKPFFYLSYENFIHLYVSHKYLGMTNIFGAGEFRSH